MPEQHTTTHKELKASSQDLITWKDPGSEAPQINSRTSPGLISFISWVSRTSKESLRFPFFMAFSLLQWTISQIDSPDSRFDLPNEQLDPIGYYETIVNIAQEAIISYQNDLSPTGAQFHASALNTKVKGSEPGHMPDVDQYKQEIEFLRAQLLKKDEIIQSGQSIINTLSQLLASKQTQE